MRISDWSSDVCSSDLSLRNPFVLRIGQGKSNWRVIIQNFPQICAMNRTRFYNSGEYSMNLDARDRAILRLLQVNARQTHAEIGEQVGLSPSACPRRIRLLAEVGHIAASTIVLGRSDGADGRESGRAWGREERCPYG